ncbi:MAG: biosynthetic arginine decarboxylase [Phycisphaerales bacterium JB063]
MSTPPPPPNTSSRKIRTDEWTREDSADLYRLGLWGRGMFNINKKGHLVVTPSDTVGAGVDLKKLTDELAKRDLHAPVLIRFTDLLQQRLREIANAFATAIAEHEYEAGYHAVYPIKVNQQRHVVESMMELGRSHGFGLEAGSKPELIAVMAMVDDPNTPIICNGFKDRQFIEAVILATKLGRNIVPVVEKFSELNLIIEESKKHNVRPQIGVRIKLASRGTGRWEHSAGERSKFGLFVSEVLDMVERLREADMLDCLTLLHCHVGSQLNDIRKVKAVVTELARLYCELYRIGAKAKFVDIGGGLGVDYDGSNSAQEGSVNYTLQEYANDIIYHMQTVCDATETPHPTIISESGRAMAAHHSVLIFNVLGWSGFDRFDLPESFDDESLEEMPEPVRTLAESYAALNSDNYTECYHDAQMAREQTLSLFNLGYCSIEHRGLAERLFFSIGSRVLRYVRDVENPPEEFANLEMMLSDIYFCNCSIFQSLPDHWAIDHRFPVMPIHRLNDEPTCRGILADITCDSDGKIDKFIGDGEPEYTLPLHPYTGADYYLAAFLVGAYQETLGDLHNLFGDTNAVHIRIGPGGEVEIEEVVEGDTVREVLAYVQYQPEELRRSFTRAVEKSVREQRLTLDEARTLRRFYEKGLAGSTYLT